MREKDGCDVVCDDVRNQKPCSIVRIATRYFLSAVHDISCSLFVSCGSPYLDTR
jgi:hypothetical protein